MLRLIKNIYHLSTAIFATLWFRNPGPRLTIIGITGTDGKTTTATLIFEILRKAGFRVSVITSVHAVIGGRVYDTGYHVTTPNAFWIQKYLRDAVENGDTHVVLEVTSHALSQHRVFGIHFTVGVLTNITHEHLDWHGTFENYLATKVVLLQNSKTAILNRDDRTIYTSIVQKVRNAKIITYGFHSAADVHPGTYPFHIRLPGTYNMYNCLAAAACCFALGVKRSIILSAIENFNGIPGRMEIMQKTPFRVIVDFAHTPNAIEQVLQTVRSMTKHKIIHVFGSAGLRDTLKRPLMGHASEKYADVIILTEEDHRTESVERIMDDIAEGIRDKRKIMQFPYRGDAIRHALQIASRNDTVIITGKGHEQSLCRGTVEYPWSDQDTVRKLLQIRVR